MWVFSPDGRRILLAVQRMEADIITLTRPEL